MASAFGLIEFSVNAGSQTPPVVGVSDPDPPSSVAEASGLGALLAGVTYTRGAADLTEVGYRGIGLREADYR